MEILHVYCVVFIGVHLLVCFLVLLLTKANVLKSSSAVFPLVFFIPVFGILCLLFLEKRTREANPRIEELGLEELKVNDEVHKSIFMEQGLPEDRIIPLQEALIINDATVRRELMLDVLYEGAENQLDALRSARGNDDAEVVHYATTAMVEMQKTYDERLRDTQAKYNADPSSSRAQKDYSQALEDYIASGLLEGNMLMSTRRQYDEILGKQLEAMDLSGEIGEVASSVRRHFVKMFDNLLIMGDYSRASDIASHFASIWPQREESYLMRLKIGAATQNGAVIDAACNDIKRHSIHLSPDGRKILTFWRREDCFE